jgi:hypothetical protein
MPRATPSGNQPHRYQWHQVKQDYADLVDRKTGVMHCIEGLNRELEPAAVQAVHPVMGKDKNAEPDEENQVVKADTPEKNVLDLIRGHGAPPITERHRLRIDESVAIYP